MIVDPDFPDHWKTRTLVALLGDDECAPVYVIRLWAHCHNRRQWEFASLPAAAIKGLCHFRGDAKLLEDSLIESGFIRRNSGVLIVVGWEEYNSSLIAKWSNGKQGGRPKKNNPPITETESRLPETTIRDNLPITETAIRQTDRIGLDRIGLDTLSDKNEDKQSEQVDGFILKWNSTPGVVKVERLRKGKRLSSLKARLHEKDWNWQLALTKFPLKCFAETGEFTPHLEWFTRPDTVDRILEGTYDWAKSTSNGHPPPPPPRVIGVPEPVQFLPGRGPPKPKEETDNV